MPASFTLTLDTQAHVEAAINGGKSTTSQTIVTLELALDPDAALVKIWGDLNPLDPMNAGMGTTEAAAEWLEPSADWLVALTTNPGGKELHVAVRDDVDNEARASAAIILEGEGPPVPPVEPEPTHPEPLPARGGPEVVPRPERRELVSVSAVGGVSSTSVVVASRSLAPVGAGPIAAASSSVSSRRSDRSQIATHVDTSVAARAPVPGSSFGRAESVATIERRDGESFIAALIELGIL
jgi:hypothetical protein